MHAVLPPILIHVPYVWQSKVLITIYKCGAKIDRNNVFDCRSIAICPNSGDKWQSKTLVSNNFLSMFIDSINIFDCCLSGVLN